MKHLHTLYALSFFSAISAAHANDQLATNADTLEEIEVIGTRLENRAHDDGESLAREWISQVPSSSAGNMLNTLPGITVLEPGGAGGVTEIFIRGADANFTSVLVDGVLMNDTTDSRGGAFDFSSISLFEINRIDLVKGPFSAIHGSGALAGVINIDTSAPPSEKLGAELQMEAGDDDYQQIGGKLFTPMASGHASIVANTLDYGTAVEGSTRTLTTFSGNFHRNIKENTAIKFTARVNQHERTTYPFASGGPRLAVSDLQESSDVNETSLGASTRWKGKKLKINASLNYFQREEQLDTPGIPEGILSAAPASISENEFDRMMLTLNSSGAFHSKIDWSAGLEYRDEQGQSEGELDLGIFTAPTDFDLNRDTLSQFGEIGFRLHQGLSFFAGLRNDDFSDVESSLSPRAGVVYQANPEAWRVSLNAGEARKAPSFYALGDPLVGNPALKPEDSSGWDIQGEWPLANKQLTLTLAAYQYTYTNLIDFDFASFSLVNRSEVESEGWEATLNGRVGSQWQWQISTSANDNEVDGEDNALLHRPDETAAGWVQWALNKKTTIVLTARYVGSRESSSIPGGAEKLPSYTVSDLALNIEALNNVRLRITLNNIFDKNYESVAGFPSAGREIRLSSRLTL